MSQQPSAFGELLSHYRSVRGLSLRDIQERMGMSATNLSRIERGVVPPPSPEVIDRIAEALDVPSEQFRRAAGLATDDQSTVVLEEAILADNSLDEDEKQFLLKALRLVRERPVRS